MTIASLRHSKVLDIHLARTDTVTAAIDAETQLTTCMS